MKKIYLSLLAILIFAGGILAQTVTIGTGTTTSTASDNGNPIYRSSATSGFGWSLSGHLYTSAQLSGLSSGATINSFAFKKTSAFGTAAGRTGTMKVYMRNSSASTLSNTTTLATVQGYTLVYTNALQSIPVAAGFVPITLTTPIVYTGGSLEIYIDWAVNGASSGLSTGAFIWEYSTGTTQVIGNSASAAFTGASVFSSQPATRSYNLQLIATPPPPCSGAPTGVVSTGPAAACIGVAFPLSATTTSTGTGLTYQWQSAPPSGFFTDISGATTATYNAIQSTATDYQCIVTCSGTSSTTSNVVSVAQNSFLNCYCITTPSTGGTADIITNVTMGTLNNTTTYVAPAYFTSYNNTAVNLSQGTSQSISITFGADGSQHSAVWIDFNQNGIYEATENVALSSSAAAASATVTYSLAIPLSATLGNTRMRVRGGSDVVYTAAGACTASAYGETEDYLVNITAPPACLAPTGLINSSVTSSSASHSWTATSPVPGVGYEWAVTTSSTPPASGTATTAITATSTGLMPNTTYYLHVRSNCGTGFSVWSTSSAFYTGYCLAGSSSATSFINDLTTTGGTSNISNLASGYSTGGYGDFTAQKVTQVQGGAITVTGVYYSAADDGAAIYVDFNDNLIFETAEKVYSSAAYQTGLSATFTVPVLAPAGNHRMRIVIDYNSINPASCGTISRGEFEDYTLEVVAAPPCVGPINGGTATSSVSTVCGSGTTILNATGTSTGTGLTFQWQSSPAGMNTFTNITGGTTLPYTTGAISASTDFRLVVTCANGPASGTSTTVTLSIGAVPSNDLVCNASPLVLDGAVQCGNSTCATTTGNEPSTFGPSTPNNTTWYSYTPSTTGVFNVTMSAPSGVTTGLLNGWLGIFSTTGTCPSALTFTEVSPTVGINFNLTTTPSVLITTPSLTAGTTYYFMIDGVSGAFGEYCISLQSPPSTPPNCTTNTTPLNGATGVAITPNIPLQWAAAATASSYDLYFGTTNPPTTLLNTFTVTSITLTGAVLGTTYYWYVSPKNAAGNAVGCSSSVTSFTTAAPPPPPSNDNATGAISLTVGGGCTTNPYDNTNATQGATEPFPSCKGTAGFAGMWYSFVAPASGVVKISCDGAGTLGDSRMGLYSASNVADYTTFNIIACDDDNGITTGARSLFYAAGLTAGTTYYVNVDLFSSGSTRGTYCITVDELASSMITTTATDCTADQASINSYNAGYTGWVSLVDAAGNINANVRQTAGTATSFTSSRTIKTGVARVDGIGQSYLNRNFLVNGTGATAADLQLFFTDAELTNLGGTLANLSVSRVPGATCNADFTGVATSLLQTTSGSVNGASFVQVSTPGFSNFYIKGGAAALPIAIEYINGTKQTNGNVIDWKVSCTSVPSVVIELQRSADARSFRTIHTETATDVRCQQAFTYNDASPLPGVNYYRLKATEPNGSSRLSNIIALVNKDKGYEIVSLAPNPVRTIATLTLSSAKADKVNIVITDIVGQVLTKQANTLTAGNNRIDMNFDSFAAGTYTITVTNSDGEVKTTRFMKY